VRQTTDVPTLIEQSAPARPACFADDALWKSWLLTAHVSGIRIVRRADHAKGRGANRTERHAFYVMLPTKQIAYCLDCPMHHMHRMQAAKRCDPTEVSLRELADSEAYLDKAPRRVIPIARLEIA
jgi:hypothetical protein